MAGYVVNRAIACLALLVALVAWPAAASADADRIVIPAAAVSTSEAILELVDPASGAAQPFAGTGQPPTPAQPTWSHDASTIAFYLDHNIVTKPAAGGTETVLVRADSGPPYGRPLGPSLSPTSDEFAYWWATYGADNKWHNTLKVTTLDGQSTRNVAGPYLDVDLASMGQPAWSPDGNSIAFPFQRGIVKVPATGGAAQTLVPAAAGLAVGSPSFSPDAARLAYLKFFLPLNGGSAYRWQVIVRVLAGGSEKVVADVTVPNEAGARLGPQAWSPDGTQIAYGSCGSLAGCSTAAQDRTLNVVNADGTGDHVLLHRWSIAQTPAWSRPSGGPVITIQAPQPGAKLSGREAVGAAEQKLTLHVDSSKPLAGVCYAVQTDPIPVPDEPSCTNASGPTSAPFEFTTDLRPLIDAGTITDGENTIRVWAYDEDGARGSAAVKISLARRNYYVKHVEVAEALSPAFGPLAAVDPLQAAPYALAWAQPSVAGFPIPLIAGRSTVLRIYVGDASLEAGKTETASIHYKVGAGAASEERDQTVTVTAPDVAPTQGDTSASINVWLPAAVASSASALTANVEVNAGEATPECDGCYPHGNRAAVSGIAFEEGGTIDVRPVPIQLVDAGGRIVAPSSAYDNVWSGAGRYLPVGEGRLAVAPGAGSVVATLAELATIQSAHPADGSARCSFLLDQVKVLRAVAAAPAGERWVGIASPPSYVGCNGIAFMPGTSIVLTIPREATLAHELAHSFGVDHTLSLAGAPAGAPQLPYTGLGAFGYDRLAAGVDIYDGATTSDLMGYDDNPRWTSPATWSRTHVGILAGVGSLRGARAATIRGGATAARSVRRLVSGYISGDHGVIFSSLVAPASSPGSAGPVAGKIIALDKRGHALASASVLGTAIGEDGSPPILPFVIALPPTATATSLALRAPNGKKLASLRRSRHAPHARFIRLPRRASARRRLTVRWKATDADRNRLTVTLLARRGKTWRALAVGPAAHAVQVLPRALGSGARLRLRLLVSDGLTTTRADARPVAMRG